MSVCVLQEQKGEKTWMNYTDRQGERREEKVAVLEIR